MIKIDMYDSKYFNKTKKGIYKEYFFYECSRHKSQRGKVFEGNAKDLHFLNDNEYDLVLAMYI